MRHVLRTSTASLVQLAAPADARTSRAATGRTRPRVSPQPVVRGAPARSSRCRRPTRPRRLNDGVLRRCQGRHEARVTVEVHKPHQAIDRGPVASRSVQTSLPRAQGARRGRASRSRGSDAPEPPSSRSDLPVRRPRRIAASFVDDYRSASAGRLGDGAARQRDPRAGFRRPANDARECGAAADAVDARKAAVTTYPGASVVSTLVAIRSSPCEDGARPKNAAPAPHRGRARTRAREADTPGLSEKR